MCQSLMSHGVNEAFASRSRTGWHETIGVAGGIQAGHRQQERRHEHAPSAAEGGPSEREPAIWRESRVTTSPRTGFPAAPGDECR
jgi:hypothetical protein